MEDTLRVVAKCLSDAFFLVLILVLMEDTLRDFYTSKMKLEACLNPCFNGRYSQSYFDTEKDEWRCLS